MEGKHALRLGGFRFPKIRGNILKDYRIWGLYRGPPGREITTYLCACRLQSLLRPFTHVQSSNHLHEGHFTKGLRTLRRLATLVMKPENKTLFLQSKGTFAGSFQESCRRGNIC